MNTSKRNYIPVDELIIGRDYRCDARNFEIGMWDGEMFKYLRYKFGWQFEDTEYHWDKGAPHGTCKPLELIEE